MKPKVIALDLEKTLISDARTCKPRPGLYEFLEFCCDNFERVVMFTAVYKKLFDTVIVNLVRQGHIPQVFLDRLEYVDWDGRYKDLEFIPNAMPAEIIFVDDDEGFINPAQKSHWIWIDRYNVSSGEDDRELLRVRCLLEQKLEGD
jgi:hypothetical protein